MEPGSWDDGDYVRVGFGEVGDVGGVKMEAGRMWGHFCWEDLG